MPRLSEAGAVVRADDGEPLIFDVPIGERETDGRLAGHLRAIARWLSSS
jgi:hypothetical protein